MPDLGLPRRFVSIVSIVALVAAQAIMWSEGAGSEVMQRIAAPMIGGMITAPLLSMFVVPAAYYLMRRRGLARRMPIAGTPLARHGAAA
jgi:Cu(I)/Ag(I) efflux system membrane protein CusA/SilA